MHACTHTNTHASTHARTHASTHARMQTRTHARTQRCWQQQAQCRRVRHACAGGCGGGSRTERNAQCIECCWTPDGVTPFSPFLSLTAAAAAGAASCGVRPCLPFWPPALPSAAAAAGCAPLVSAGCCCLLPAALLLLLPPPPWRPPFLCLLSLRCSKTHTHTHTHTHTSARRCGAAQVSASHGTSIGRPLSPSQARFAVLATLCLPGHTRPPPAACVHVCTSVRRVCASAWHAPCAPRVYWARAAPRPRAPP
jgi:hypothetical protein